MKKIFKNSDLALRLNVKDCNGKCIPLNVEEEAVIDANYIVYTDDNTEDVLEYDRDAIKKDNILFIEKADLNKLGTGQIKIKLYAKFYSNDYDDAEVTKNILTDLVLLEDPFYKEEGEVTEDGE